MRGNSSGLLAIALMCACAVAHASIIYNVNLTDGTETVTGTITTDGHTGALVAADITGLSLQATGPIPSGPYTFPAGAGVVCAVAGCGLNATLFSLDLSGALPDFIEFYLQGFITFQDIQFYSGGVSVFNSQFSQLGAHLIPEVAPYVIGRASVPEPATVTLLVLALAALGFTRKRSSKGRADAV